MWVYIHDLTTLYQLQRLYKVDTLITSLLVFIITHHLENSALYETSNGTQNLPRCSIDIIFSRFNPIHILTFCKIHFNTILPSTSKPIKEASSFETFQLNFVWISHFSHACYLPPAYIFLRHFVTHIFGEEWNYEAPHYAAFFSLLLLPTSYV